VSSIESEATEGLPNSSHEMIVQLQLVSDGDAMDPNVLDVSFAHGREWIKLNANGNPAKINPNVKSNRTQDTHADLANCGRSGTSPARRCPAKAEPWDGVTLIQRLVGHAPVHEIVI